MKIDNHIDKYIERERAIKPEPYFETRLRAKIEHMENERQSERKISILWQSAVFAASIAIVVMLGIGLGNSYKPAMETGVMINDNYIENFSIYLEDESF